MNVSPKQLNSLIRAGMYALIGTINTGSMPDMVGALMVEFDMSTDELVNLISGLIDARADGVVEHIVTMNSMNLTIELGQKEFVEIWGDRLGNHFWNQHQGIYRNWAGFLRYLDTSNRVQFFKYLIDNGGE